MNNVPGDLRASLSLTLGVHNTLNTGHYLGIPSLVGRNKKQNFNYIKESMWFILQGWRGKKHSKAGKEIRIKVAAQSISTYCMSTFLRPSILLDNLYLAVMLLKGLNGLILIIYIGWRLIKEPSALVCRVLKAKYFPNSHFLDIRLGQRPSFMWSGIQEAQKLIRREVRWKVGNGEDIRFWSFPWLNDMDDFFLQTPLVHGFHDMLILDLFYLGLRQWDYDNITTNFNPRNSEAIIRTPISSQGCRDWLI
ncbi:hypothetical protein ACS0TY_004132 [Phlomoides rotata]